MSHPSDARPLPDHLSDSAGRPWAGRRLEPSTAPSDDGSEPEEIGRALRAFAAGSGDEVAVVDAMRSTRFLIPLVAHLGEEGDSAHGLRTDKTQELAVVTVAGPDGRNVLPVFTSVAAMSRWDRAARPVPVDGRRVALAAAGESTELVVIDPAGDQEFAVRRPALRAVGRGEPWLPSHRDPLVLDALVAGAAGEEAVAAIRTEAGDPTARLRGPETVVLLGVRPGLDREAVSALVARLGGRWASDPVVAERVDSLTVRLIATNRA